MNNAFLKNSKIGLDNKYHLESDGNNGICLVFQEVREKENKKTGKMEDFLFEDRWWFTRFAQSLRKYVELTLNNSTSFEEIIEKEDKIYSLIDSIDRDFKQFN